MPFGLFLSGTATALTTGLLAISTTCFVDATTATAAATTHTLTVATTRAPTATSTVFADLLCFSNQILNFQ
jgi:hypothetical protein